MVLSIFINSCASYSFRRLFKFKFDLDKETGNVGAGIIMISILLWDVPDRVFDARKGVDSPYKTTK